MEEDFINEQIIVFDNIFTLEFNPEKLKKVNDFGILGFYLKLRLEARLGNAKYVEQLIKALPDKTKQLEDYELIEYQNDTLRFLV